MSEGRIAFVTGGSKGIGLACVHRLQRDGYRVAATWRSNPPEELPRFDGTPLLSVRCDVTSPEELEAAFETVESELGAVEVLVCSAGITDDALLLRMSEERWEKVIETNLTATYRAVKRASARMLRARYGRIIIVSSVVAYLGSAGQTNYAASKAGLIGFARSLARELAGRGVTVNVVAPGVIATDMTAALGAGRLQDLTALVPLGRAGEPEEVADAVAWLAGDGSGYVTGAVIPVDGGLGMGH